MEGRTFEQSESVRTEYTFLKGSRTCVWGCSVDSQIFLIIGAQVLEFPSSIFLFLVSSLNPRRHGTCRLSAIPPKRFLSPRKTNLVLIVCFVLFSHSNNKCQTCMGLDFSLRNFFFR